MRNYFILFILMSFGITQAQITLPFFTLNVGKNNYIKSIVYLEDGTIKDGYVLDFLDQPVIKSNIQYNIEQMGNIENSLGRQKDFYYFKQDEKSKDEKISMDDIKRIEWETSKYNQEILGSIVYEKTKIAWANNDGTMNFKDKSTLLTVIKSNSKVTIYAILVNEYPTFYIRSKEDEYAVIPIRITAADIFNPKQVEQRYFTAFQYFGKRCPDYVSKLEEYKKDGNISALTNMQIKASQKEFTNGLKIMRKAYSNDLKKAKKELKKDELRDYRELRRFQYNQELADYYYDALFNEAVLQYINSCD